MIIRYDSPAALRLDYIARCKGRNIESPFSTSWYNNETEEETLRKAELGDTSLVAAAEEQLSKLDTAIETPRNVWERNVAGAYACVPDVLAGLPTPMRRMVHQRDETNPITIYVDTASSAYISAEVFAQRGITILALVMALTRIRPVQLFQMDNGDGYKDGTGETVVISEINTHPLDLATACYVLTSVAFARRLCYSLEEVHNGFSGQWARGYSHSNPTLYYDGLKTRLGVDASRCLMIPGAHLRDELITSPLAWIERQIAHFTTEQQTEGFAQ